MKILVFDIETVPDTDAGARIHGLDGLPEEDVVRAMEHLYFQKSGSEFLPPHLHRIVAVSIVFKDLGKPLLIRSLGEPDSDEAEIVRQFFGAIDKHTPRLVSWNGSGFDLPVLRYRALVHGISARVYWERGDANPSFRFDNYLARYHWRHLDLMEVLAEYQPRLCAPLEHVAKLLGFPGKQGLDGSGVAVAWRAGETEEIRNYCEIDALNTYLIYRRLELMQGTLTADEHKELYDETRQFLADSGLRHFRRFLDAWDDAAPKA